MTFFLTAISLIAFAANSLLCRMALGDNLIDPISFTTLRLASGALMLLIVSQRRTNAARPVKAKGSWKSALALFAYACAFSLGYKSVTAGMGTLILVGSVQITMIGWAVASGEKLSFLKWLGSAISMSGLVYLVLPGISAPDPIGTILMFISGAAWGVYTIRGKDAAAPIAMTSANFYWAAPLAILASVIFSASTHLEPAGVLLAVISGSITSALGYVVWYKALRHLTTSQASIVQLLIPVLTAFGGVAFLSEHISGRLLIGSSLILGGVGMGIIKKTHQDSSSSECSTLEP
ncbi:MAG: DMT family transporter [Pontiella sp.]